MRKIENSIAYAMKLPPEYSTILLKDYIYLYLHRTTNYLFCGFTLPPKKKKRLYIYTMVDGVKERVKYYNPNLVLTHKTFINKLLRCKHNRYSWNKDKIKVKIK